MPSPPDDSVIGNGKSTSGTGHRPSVPFQHTFGDTPNTPIPPDLGSHRSGLGVVGGATVVLGGRVIGLAISFGSLAFLARLLTPADYGLLAMILSITAFLSVFSDMGLTLVTVQRPQISQEQLSTLFWVNAAFGLFLGVVAVTLAPALVWFYQDPRLLLATIALAGVFPLSSLGVQHQALLKRHMMFHRLAVVRLLGQGIGATTAIVAAYGGLGYWALVSQPLATITGQTIAAWVLMRWRPGGPRRCEELRSMLGFGGRLTIHGILGYFANRLDKVLLGRFFGSSSLGLYSMAYNLMTKPIMLAGGSVGDAAIPVLSRAARNPAVMRAAYRRLLCLACLWGLPACAAGIFWADDIVLTLLGYQWIEAIPIISLLCLAAVPRLLSISTGWLYVGGGRVARMLRWQMMWSPFVALAFLVGLPFGVLGVAGAYALASWIALLPCFAYCFHRTDFTMYDMLKPFIPTALCSVFACVLAIYGQVALLPEAEPGLSRLGMRLCIAMILYTGTTAVFVPLANEGLRKLVNQLRGVLGGSRRAD